MGTDGVALARGPYRTDTLPVTTAERYEIIFRPTRAGTFPVRYDFLSYYGRRAIGSASAYVIVT